MTDEQDRPQETGSNAGSRSSSEQLTAVAVPPVPEDLPEEVIEDITQRRIRVARIGLIRDYGVYAALLVLIIFNIIATPHFLEAANFRVQLVQVAPVVIVALGMAMVIGTEGIDLSVGAVMALSGALIPLYLGYGVPVAIVVAMLGGVAAGLFSGVLVAYVGVQPIVATLALLVGLRGVAQLMLGGQFRNISSPSFNNLGTGSVLGIPIVVLIAAVLALLVGFLVRRTTFGRRLVAIGGNPAASRLAGLPVRRTLLTVYVLSGVLAAIAGILLTAYQKAGTPSTQGLLMELTAITAVVVGGTPLTGGRVRVVGTVAGALLMQLVTATLIKHNLPESSTQMVQAAIIVLAVYLQRDRGGVRR